MNTLLDLPPTSAAWLHESEFASFVPAYGRRLDAGRYAVSTRQVYFRCLAHFAHWLAAERRSAGILCDEDISRFLDEHLPNCACLPSGRRCRSDNRAALRLLLAVLADGRVAVPHKSASVIEAELRRFDEHLLHDRGLALSTRTQRLSIVRAFLLQRSGADAVEISPVRACNLRRFIDEMLHRWSPASAHILAGTLRSYLRFRSLLGDPIDHLLPVVASPAHWRLAALPEILSPEEIARVLAHRSPHGRSTHRAYAMIRCLVDLGLRAHEVASLDLDAIEWSTGTLRIGPTKSRRVDVMPLLAATGSALATYLQFERPPTQSRRAFVRHVAPVGVPIGPGVVRWALREAYQACGLPHTRAHVLRHSLASRLLGNGASLKEVADVLRHRHLDTTLVYAKIDVAHLASVALPWPGGAS